MKELTLKNCIYCGNELEITSPLSTCKECGIVYEIANTEYHIKDSNISAEMIVKYNINKIGGIDNDNMERLL